jgi:hypothetical protein
VLHNKSDESVLDYTLGLDHIFSAGEKNENWIFFEFPLSAPHCSFWLLDFVSEPLQFNCIAIRLFKFLHPPTTPWGLAQARTLGTLGNLQFLVPHSLTLPEYLAQFECKLDYYLLMFTMCSSSVASLFLVSPCDKANMFRDLRRNVFFHRQMEKLPLNNWIGNRPMSSV